MLNNGIDPTGAKQAITHYSCEKCRPKQELYDINNIFDQKKKQLLGL